MSDEIPYEDQSAAAHPQPQEIPMSNFYIIKAVIAQSHNSYEGEHAPEVIVAWDEYSIDNNPEGWFAEVDAARKRVGDDEDFSAVRVVEIRLVDSQVYGLFDMPKLDVVGVVGDNPFEATYTDDHADDG